MKYADLDSYYKFRQLKDLTDEVSFSKLTSKLLQNYSKITKKWSDRLNSEWTCRTYFASNLILNTTVLLLNDEYADKKNIRIVRPYLHYYSVLSLLRCIVLTLPEQKWNDGNIMELSHKKTIDIAFDYISKFNKEKAIKIKDNCLYLKAKRELIAYRVPASGDRNLKENYDIIEICTILTEIAELNSILLEISVTKNASLNTFCVHTDEMNKIFKINIDGYTFKDNSDYSRLDYASRKIKRPYNLSLFMTEGQTEDYIGAWEKEVEENETNEDIFSLWGPKKWQIIFDIP